MSSLIELSKNNQSKTNRSYTFAIFDWDGTLMDSTARIISCMQETARIADLPIPTVAAIKSIIGLSMDTVIDKMFPGAETHRRKFLTDTYREQYVELDSTPSPLFNGSLGLLNWLRERDILMAVATGKARAGLNRALESVELLNYFEFSVCADEAMSKPHPEMILRLLEQTGKTIDETIVIGDSVHDLGMASNAGVDSIGVTSGANSFDELSVHQPIEIYEQVDQIRQHFI